MSAYTAPSFTLATSIPQRGVSAAVLLVGVRPSDKDSDKSPRVVDAQLLDKAAVKSIEAALTAVGATGSAEQLTRVVVDGLPVASVLAVGLGRTDDAETIRRAAAVAARSLDNVEILVTTLSERDVDATVQGLVLGGYRFAEFRSAKTAPKDAGLQKVTLLVGDKGRAQKEAMERGAAVATAVVTARDFVNTPPSHLFPAEFAKRAKALATAEGIEVEVLDEKELAKGGYGGIVGVGKGSSRPPRLVRLTYRGAKGKKAKSVALVGKGITFDTGGISIKPAGGMENMTSDMGGAAAVIAVTLLAARQQLPIDVIATVPMAENMPSSTAQRPGDVLTQLDGTTVEVINTDAEGRLILADAIVRLPGPAGLPDRHRDADRCAGCGARHPHPRGDGHRRVPRPGVGHLAVGWRERLGHAAARGAARRSEVPGGRPGQCHQSPQRRHARRRPVPARVRRRRGPVGAHRRRRSRVQHRRAVGLHAQGRHRRAGADHLWGAGGHRRQRVTP